MLSYCLIFRKEKVIGYTTSIFEADNICDLYKDLIWVLIKTRPPEGLVELTVENIAIN